MTQVAPDAGFVVVGTELAWCPINSRSAAAPNGIFGTLVGGLPAGNYE